MTERILAILRSHDVPTIGFVTGRRVLVQNQVDARIEMLQRWLDAGAALGNHRFSHVPLSRITMEEYVVDIIKGDLFPAQQMARRGQKPRYFRAPENDLGASLDVHNALREFLATLDYVLVPFTIAHADYAFNRAFLLAETDGDTEAVKRVMVAYLDHLDRAFGCIEELSAEMFQRQIPQIFLLHANQINANALDDMLLKLEDRGYDFVSLEEALRDPAYSTRDEYGGSAGISWFHRWSLSLGYGTRETPSGRSLPQTLWREPDAPAFVLKLAEQSP